MKAVGSAVVVLATLAVCGGLLYEHYPREQRHFISSPDYVMVQETKPRKVVQSLTIDGKKLDVEIVAYDTVERPVTMAKTQELITQVSKEEMLTYWLMVCILGVLGLYAIATFVFWVRDKWSRQEGKGTEDTKKRWDDLVKICISVLLTLLGSAGLTRESSRPPPVNVPHAASELPADSPAIPSSLEPSPRVVPSVQPRTF